MRAGVAGVGHLGFHHARLLKGIADHVTVFDTDPERLSKVSSELGVEAAGSLEELMRSVDAMVVACPTVGHHQVARKALSMGVPVLVEKPVAATVAEAADLVALAANSGLVLAVGHVERFNPAMTAAMEHIHRPLYIEANRLSPFTPRCTDVSVVMDLMIHDIDLVLSLIRSPVADIQASGVPVLTGTVDIAGARIAFQDGSSAVINASRISLEQVRKLRVFQEGGYVSVDFGAKTVHALSISGGAIIPVPVVVTDHNALEMELRDFLMAVESGGEPAITGADGLRALETAETVLRKSAESFQRIRESR
ncbi:MAG: Gfo/Idh/MocA family oxidoreductase [Candidatus Fermentibacteraceae bacterium]